MGSKVVRSKSLNQAAEKENKEVKSYPIGYFHLDIAKVRTEEGKMHLFVATGRTSKFAYAEWCLKATRATAREFLEHLIAASSVCNPHNFAR